ncbi:MAG TPA: metallopeptidase family protein [Dehalococcoidia bacterium]|nr:metallopeptidase family protein [Dehalococcoidia bacterium]
MTDGEAGPRRRYARSPGERRHDGARRQREERRGRFLELVQRAIDELPPAFAEAIENVDIVVASRPTRAELREAGLGPGGVLLGLYQGIPLTRRGSSYNLALPDKITLYQDVIERSCASEEELVHEVRATLLHELAHHFGIDDDRLDELGR